MTIEFNCPTCNRAYKVKDELAGKRATCSGCKKPITVPTPGAGNSAAPEPAAASKPAEKATPPRPAEPVKPTTAGQASTRPPATAPAAKPPAASPSRREETPSRPGAESAPRAAPAARMPAPSNEDPTKKMPRVSAAPPPAREAAARAPTPAAKALAPSNEDPTKKMPRVSTAAKETSAAKEAVPAKEPLSAGPSETIKEPAASAPPARTPEPAKEADIVTFNCPQCDEEVKVASNLAGRQTPCPACGRIVKVPQAIKQEPVEWRRTNELLAAATARLEDKSAPSSATASAATRGPLARPATAFVPEEAEEPVSRAQKIKRLVAVAAGLSVLALGTWLTLQWMNVTRQQRLVARAVQAAENTEPKTGLSKLAAAEIYRAAGEFYLRRDDPEQARGYFEKARARLLDAPEPTERDAALIDLAVSQIELGGTPAEVDKEKRLEWSIVQGEVQQTLQLLRFAGARSEAIRAAGRQLVRKQQVPILVALARSLEAADQAPQVLALVGLERLQAGDRQTAEALFEEGLHKLLAANLPPEPKEPDPRPPEPKEPADGEAALKDDSEDEPPDEEPKQPDHNKPPPEGELPPLPPETKPPPPPPFPPAMVALGLALNKAERVSALRPQRGAPPAHEVAWVVGRAEGLAWQGNLEAAVSTAKSLAAPEERLQALVAVAGVVLENKSADTRLLEQAIQLAQRQLRIDKPVNSLSIEESARYRANQSVSWDLLRLVRLAHQAGLSDQARKLTTAMVDVPLRGRAQLELFRASLESSGDKAEETAADAVDKLAPAHALARLALARHNTRLGDSAIQTAVEGWPANQKPFGLIGIALGMQK